MPSFLIAEDHSVVRMGTIFMIRSLYPDAVIAEAETFDDAIAQLQVRSFDLLLLDIHIPGGDNLQMVEAVKLRQPDISVLIFSSYEEQLYAVRYLKAGASGYLHKKSSTEAIKAAIARVLNGEKYISPAVQEKLLEEYLNPRKGKSSGTMALLSAREVEVMQLLVRGVSASEIKGMLNIHSSTLSTHKASIFEKMNVSNIVELAEKVKMHEQIQD